MTPIPEPRIDELPVGRLTIDHTVQRPLDTARVDRIAGDYQLGAVGVLVVSERANGAVHVIDGQHRHAATVAAGYGDKTLTCLVYRGLSLADEAAMFRRLNNSRAVSAVDKFRVRVIEGDPGAVAMNAVLERHGWTVAFSKADGSFAAVAGIEQVFRGPSRGKTDGHADVCDTVIGVITRAWGHDSDGVRAEIVAGIGAVIHRHGAGVDLSKLVSALAAHPGGPRGLVGKAKGLREYRGGTVTEAFAEVLIGLINKSRRTNRLPDWHSTA